MIFYLILVSVIWIILGWIGEVFFGWFLFVLRILKYFINLYLLY